MKKNRAIVSVLLVFVFLSVITGCDKKESINDASDEKNEIKKELYTDLDGWKVPKPLISGDKKQHVARPSIVLISNKAAILYSTKKEVIFNYNNNDVVIDAKSGSTQIWLFKDKQEKNIYTFWWRKEAKGLKSLYFRGSSDLGKTFSKVVKVNSSGGVLPTISFYSNGNGKLAVAYYDERDPTYRLYSNVSTDNGITWKKQDIRLDNDDNARMVGVKGKQLPLAYAINPLLAFLDGGKLIAVWQQRKIVDGRSHAQIVSRVSKDFGETWQKEQVVYTSHIDMTVETGIVSDGKRVVVVAAYPQKGLVGFVATDSNTSENLNWINIGSVAETKDVNEVSWLKPAISGEKLKVAYIIQKSETSKYIVEVASLDFASGQWGKAFRLDRDKKQPVETKATYLDLKALPNGEFVAVWEDYRSIIPMLMLDYTQSKGTAWQKEALKLTRAGLSQIKYPQVLVAPDSVWVNFEWYIMTGGALPRLSTLKFPIDQTTGQVKFNEAPQGKKYSSGELKAKLKKRAKELMELRVKGEWEKTWRFMDPVYREVTNKQSWLQNMGYVNYEKFKVADVKIDGSFATVGIDMTLSLRQQLRKGELMEPTPAKKTSTKTKWLWFYDEWYFFPSNSFMRHLKY